MDSRKLKTAPHRGKRSSKVKEDTGGEGRGGEGKGGGERGREGGREEEEMDGKGDLKEGGKRLPQFSDLALSSLSSLFLRDNRNIHLLQSRRTGGHHGSFGLWQDDIPGPSCREEKRGHIPGEHAHI